VRIGLRRFAIFDLTGGDIDNELPELDRVARSLEAAFGHADIMASEARRLKERGVGGSKRYMEDLEDLRRKARIVLHDAGVLDQCEFHGTYFDTWADIEGAYRLGNARISAGRLDIGGWSRCDFTDAIKHELEANRTLDGCPLCVHALAD
jgi:hypothetical protein